MKKPKTKPAAEPAGPDIVTQAEIRAVAELYDLAHDLAIEVRRRIENGARVEKGRYVPSLGRGASSIAYERKHRQVSAGTSLCGLDIEYREVSHA